MGILTFRPVYCGGEETSVPVIKEMRGPQSQSWSGGQLNIPSFAEQGTTKPVIILTELCCAYRTYMQHNGCIPDVSTTELETMKAVYVLFVNLGNDSGG